MVKEMVRSFRSVLPRRAGVILAVALIAFGSGQVPSPLHSQHALAKSHVTLTFWHYFTDRAGLFQQFANQYPKKTGVKANMEFFAGYNHCTKYQAAAESQAIL